MRSVWKPLLALLLIAGTPLLVGCSQGSGEAEVLTAPEDVDWEAIEAQGAEMAEAQNEGE